MRSVDSVEDVGGADMVAPATCMPMPLCVFRRLLANHYGLVAALIVGIGGLLAAPPQATQAATITVNTATDENTSNATCSLREGIIAATTDAAYNGCAAGSGVDTI